MANDINKLLDEANEYFYKNDYANARHLFEIVLELEPHNLLALQRLGRIEQEEGNLDKAAFYFRRSLELDPQDVNTQNELGNIYFELKDYAKALACYRQAIKIKPDYYWAYFNLGLVIRQQGAGDMRRLEEAKDWFKRALELNPEYYPALNELGLYYLEKECLAEAEEYFIKALKINPSYKYPYFNLALLAKKMAQNSKVKFYLRKALEIDPDYVPALNNLGILYYEEGKYRVAAYYFSRALEIEPHYLFALYNLGLIFAGLAEYRKAWQMFERALAEDPAYANAKQEKERLEHEFAREVQQQEGLAEEDLRSATYQPDLEEEARREKEEPKGENTSVINEQAANSQASEVEAKYFCEKFGRNITSQARAGKLFQVLGREREMQAVMEVLLKMKKNNPLIVGRAGVGKTAIVEGIAQKIVAGQVPSYFLNKEIIELNMGMLVAGTQFRGDFEKRLSQIVEEVNQNENLILFIDEIHTVLGAGETVDGSLDAANILKPALARGDLRCIGATTTEEFNKYFIKDQAFMRRFYPVHIDELSPEATQAILINLKPRLEKHYGLVIPDPLLDLIVDIAGEEIKNRVFPDKAIDILENACARAVFSGKKVLDELSIKTIVGEFIGAKFLETDRTEGERLLELETFLKTRVLGQDEAIARVARLIRLTKQRLDLNPEQPDGVFMFVGPSGVGKTYLAQQLSLFLFGTEGKCLALNMAEFSEPHAVAKLIGSPPGYVGYEESPIFTRFISENPSSLLLLDEIEKAHPEVLKLFLEIFDEGKIVDTKGRVIYFSNVTIVMTSNAGFSQEQTIGFGGEKETFEVDLTRYFPQEFLNRIDDLIVFKPINLETARLIIEKILIGRAQRTFAKKGIELSFDPLFVDYILAHGYSRRYGVRNLERTFEKEVLAEVANILYQQPGSKKIFISRHGAAQAVR